MITKEIKQPCAFLLGAGFSKWVYNKMPLMGEIIGKYNNETEEELRSRGLTNFIDPEKFEHLMSYLSGDYPWLTAAEKYYFRALNEKIKLRIVERFRELNDDLVKQAIAREIENKCENLTKFWSNNEVNIITFNYDTIVEELLKPPLGNWPLYKMPIPSILNRSPDQGDGFDSPIAKCKPTLIKLHGSVSWLYDSDSKQLYENPEWTTDRDEHSFGYAKFGLTPFIIPPVLNKTSYYDINIVNELWRSARNALEKAETIFVLGYSFPESDIYVNFLINQSIRQKENGEKKEFVFVDKNDGEEFKTRIKKMFTVRNTEVENSFTTACNLNFMCGENAIDNFICEYFDGGIKLNNDM